MGDFIVALKRGDARVKNMLDFIPSVLEAIYNIHDYINDGGLQNITKDDLFSKFLPNNYIN